MKAYESFRSEQEHLNEAAAMFKVKGWDELQERLQKMQEENAALKKEVAEANNKAMLANADSVLAKAEKHGAITSLAMSLKDFDPSVLMNYAEAIRNKMSDGVVFIADEVNGKAVFVCASSKAAIARGLKAGNLVKEAAKKCGGNGGGRPDMAQAGGRDTAGIPDALAYIREQINAL